MTKQSLIFNNGQIVDLLENSLNEVQSLLNKDWETSKMTGKQVDTMVDIERRLIRLIHDCADLKHSIKSYQ